MAYIGTGRSVYVNGCINDYRWCDISAGPNRGWAYSKFIEYPYQDRRLPIYGNGPTLALPIVSFILGSYWNDNYRNAPKDAAASTTGDCRLRVLRGGNFLSKPTEIRSASRFRYDVDVRFYGNGFRVVRDLQ